jgi:hypothetical protein
MFTTVPTDTIREYIVLHGLWGTTPPGLLHKEAYFNTASPPTKVVRASPHREGVASQAVFKSPGRQAIASARRQERYHQLDFANAAESAADAEAVEAQEEEEEARAYQMAAVGADA